MFLKTIFGKVQESLRKSGKIKEKSGKIIRNVFLKTVPAFPPSKMFSGTFHLSTKSAFSINCGITVKIGDGTALKILFVSSESLEVTEDC